MVRSLSLQIVANRRRKFVFATVFGFDSPRIIYESRDLSEWQCGQTSLSEWLCVQRATRASRSPWWIVGSSLNLSNARTSYAETR